MLPHSMPCTVEQTLEENYDLKQKLSRFWEIENVNPFDECVINQFEKDIISNRERYVTRLPFKEDRDLLPNNFETCEALSINLKRKLVDQNYLKEYNKIFKDYESKKVLERVLKNEICKAPSEVNYLTQGPVIREERDTTKIRAVFGASCSMNGPSLNECLYSVPNLLTKIFDILI